MKRCFIIFVCILCMGLDTYATGKEQTISESKYTKVLVGYEYVQKTKKVTVKKKKYLGKFYITHYCPCPQCCGIGGGKVTASGTTPTAGRTVGVNPQLLPYGTKLKIGSKKSKITYVAEDTGGGIGWRHLDVFCNTHAEALQAGVGYEKVWEIKYKTKKKKYTVKVPVYEWVRKEE